MRSNRLICTLCPERGLGILCLPRMDGCAGVCFLTRPRGSRFARRVFGSNTSRRVEICICVNMWKHSTDNGAQMKINLIHAIGVLAILSGATATSAYAQMDGSINGLGDARAQNLPTSQGISNDGRFQGAAPLMPAAQDRAVIAPVQKRKRHH